ncbi:MAG TPA: tRNA (adenosine(37)-N6)-threonylcarbamoyltransferase complex dimerization subunit type 1 TsaB [Bryobacteraceae bacterium]|nr:tRNA (adenosine(37)-N6)-threonylcarbamoyltransferase complex dimerization subunit type 1 TsaB [Bryobacteraceae bacterium]
MTNPILAIDTTSDWGSLALMEGTTLVEELALHSPDGFGHVLFDEIDKILARHRCSLEDIGRIATAAGPGSFTGVRVGLSAAKGLTEVLGIPIVGVSNLRAVASFGTGPLRAAAIDARRGDIFGAVYDASGNLVQEETVMPYRTWLETLPDGVELLPMTPRYLAAAVARIAAALPPQDPLIVDANYVRRSDAELFWKD